MEQGTAWKRYDDIDLEALDELAANYIDFISENKTERECVKSSIQMAEDCGYTSLDEAVRSGKQLKPGDKVYAVAHGKALILAHLGTAPLEEGFNILGAHIDSPRLDLKQHPLSESNGLAHLDTHYYGGIKAYQWVTVPLALHGVVAKKDGTTVDICVGENEDDPVFCVSDLLIHLASKQMSKSGNEVVEGEDLDVLVGNRPYGVPLVDEDVSLADDSAHDDAATDTSTNEETDASESGDLKKLAEKEPVKAAILQVLADSYDIDEDDFLSAEIEVVPAGRAREAGLDRSMVLGYGQDDRVCAYTSLSAQLALGDEVPEHSALCVLVDKEEIGSVGATGMASQFFENTVAELMELAGEGGYLKLTRALAASSMLSSDVSAGFDPAYASVFEPKNTAYLGCGLVFNKYTGSRGKSGSNDACAEYLARIRRVMDDADVTFQTAELGRVDAGGGGTIAYIPAKYGMDVIDSGVAVLSMHSPWEVASKADVYEAYKGYEAFLRNA